MTFEILNKNDLLAGAMLTVRFPEEDFDTKAYYTIENDMPDFLVPFRCRSVDGQIECTYQLGKLNKLQYRYGSLSPREYAQFWKQVLRPLVDCDDWFLKPFSFVMDPNYLYTDRDGKIISYLYIPSRADWGGQEELRAMAIELAQKNPVTDPMLENQTLRAMMQDFRLLEFLQMTQKGHGESEAPAAQPAKAPAPAPMGQVKPEAPAYVPAVDAAPAPKAPEGKEQQEPVKPVLSGNDDIFIDLNGSGSKEPEKKKGWNLFGGKKEKPAEAPKEPKEPRRGLFGGKKGKSREIIIGAGEEDPAQLIEARPELPRAAPAAAPVYIPQQQEDEHTQLDDDLFGAHLRLIGDTHLPGNIAVTAEPGRPFTIGRYDVSVGHKQSTFEFDKGTKAVSRRHAAIEKDGSTYWIVDLSSSAGTFVDGERLQPNVPRQLIRGCRVSFGNGGADYIWEE